MQARKAQYELGNRIFEHNHQAAGHWGGFGDRDANAASHACRVVPATMINLRPRLIRYANIRAACFVIVLLPQINVALYQYKRNLRKSEVGTHLVHCAPARHGFLSFVDKQCSKCYYAKISVPHSYHSALDRRKLLLENSRTRGGCFRRQSRNNEGGATADSATADDGDRVVETGPR